MVWLWFTICTVGYKPLPPSPPPPRTRNALLTSPVGANWSNYSSLMIYREPRSAAIQILSALFVHCLNTHVLYSQLLTIIAA
jgi:hypothetical protein